MCKELCEVAKMKWDLDDDTNTDDITVIVIFLE